jgi:surfactin family lipopeptide synthetase A
MQEYVEPIEDGTPMPYYSGTVDYFEATQMSFKDLKEDNEKSWKQLLPHMTVHPVATSHFKLLDKQNMNYCMSQIET